MSDSPITNIPDKAVSDSRRIEQERLLRQRNALIAITQQGDAGLDTTIKYLTYLTAVTLETDRVSVWLYNDGNTAIRCIDLYELSKNLHSAGAILKAEDYPMYFQAMAGLNVIVANDAQEDRYTREFTGDYLKPLGITSMLDAPLRTGGVVSGVLCHEHIGPERVWTTDEQTFVLSVANAISLALERAEHQASHAQLERLLEHCPAVIFRLRVQDGKVIPVSASPYIIRLLGYSIEEVITYEWWHESLHPDDLYLLDGSIGEGFIDNKRSFEYRVRHKDGGYRLIEDHRTLFRNAAGEPDEIIGVWIERINRKGPQEIKSLGVG